jgi:hypothetical protein
VVVLVVLTGGVFLWGVVGVGVVVVVGTSTNTLNFFEAVSPDPLDPP